MHLKIKDAQRHEDRYARGLKTLCSQVINKKKKKKIDAPIIDLLGKEFEELSSDHKDWRTPLKAKLISPEGMADLKELKDYVLIS